MRVSRPATELTTAVGLRKACDPARRGVARPAARSRRSWGHWREAGQHDQVEAFSPVFFERSDLNAGGHGRASDARHPQAGRSKETGRLCRPRREPDRHSGADRASRDGSAQRADPRDQCPHPRSSSCPSVKRGPLSRQTINYRQPDIANCRRRVATERDRNVSSCRPRARTRGRHHRARLTPLRGTAMVPLVHATRGMAVRHA